MSEIKEEQPQEISLRGDNRSRRPQSQAFRDFMGKGWEERNDEIAPAGARDYLPARHQKLGAYFPGERLVIPAGTYKCRSNDTDYRFRAHSAFAHLTGLGSEEGADAVLILEPLTDSKGNPLPYVNPSELADGKTHEARIFFRPQGGRDSEEFYADATYGEFWVGPMLTEKQMETLTGLQVREVSTLKDALAKDAGEIQIRVINGVDQNVEKTVNEVRAQAGLKVSAQLDSYLEEICSTIRLTKDDYEIAELEKAVAATKAGFEAVIKQLPRAIAHHRGERVIEGAFGAVAREEGNGLGYDTIAASGNHANTLHWISNNGKVTSGDLLLLDAGVEVDSLYTADITRTLPVNGKFSPVQARVYQAVLEACEAGLARANQKPCRFRDVHDAAVTKLVEHLDAWGILPDTAENVLKTEGQQFRRWMPHGVNHHLGLDVHDCAQACKELYMDAELEPGMCFTIEPGLYFHAEDQLIPEELRGIGCRIEDDIVVEKDGSVRRISENIPRTIAAVEAWIAQVQQG